jgi:hypothetical protein
MGIFTRESWLSSDTLMLHAQAGECTEHVVADCSPLVNVHRDGIPQTKRGWGFK